MHGSAVQSRYVLDRSLLSRVCAYVYAHVYAYADVHLQVTALPRMRVEHWAALDDGYVYAYVYVYVQVTALPRVRVEHWAALDDGCLVRARC